VASCQWKRPTPGHYFHRTAIFCTKLSENLGIDFSARLEIAQKYWAPTRARILAADARNADVLRDGIGNLAIPAAPTAAE